MASGLELQALLDSDYVSLEQLAEAVGRSVAGLRSGPGQQWRRRHGLLPVQPWPPALYDARKTYFRAADVLAALAPTVCEPQAQPKKLSPA
jgi:hypothetical protein